MLEYQESVMAYNIKPNNTRYFSITSFEKVLEILRELKTGKVFAVVVGLFTIFYLFSHLYLPIKIPRHLFLTTFSKHRSLDNCTSFLSVCLNLNLQEVP